MENKQKKILIIDDDVQYVDTVKTLLDSVGYDVSYSYKGQKGYELAREIKPDIILLDVMFAGPLGPNGFEVVKLLSSDPITKSIPIIMISGVRRTMGTNVPDELEKQSLSVTAYLEKPIKPGMLLSEIEKTLGRSTSKVS